MRIPMQIILIVIAVTLALPGEGMEPQVLNDNGGWCWHQDERAIIQDGLLVFGSVANVSGVDGEKRGGNIEMVTYDFASGQSDRSILHEGLQNDDHDTPAFLVRPDGRLLAVYAMHGNDNFIRYRRSAPWPNFNIWLPEKTFEARAGVTYANLFRLSSEKSGRGRTYNFYRGKGRLPSFLISVNDGDTWSFGHQLFEGPTFPYLKYASNHVDKIHFITTERHPRFFDNSIYHGYLQNAKAYDSNGKLLGDLHEGPIAAEDGTRVFAGDEDHNAWTSDLHLDDNGYPYCVFSVRRDGAGKKRGEGGKDFRYHYARWDGHRWHEHEIAYGGTCLYASEDSYTGNITLDPDHLNTVYLSTDVNPETGAPQPSGHYEIYRGKTTDGGETWNWTAITSGSNVDNIRPLVPKSDGKYSAVLWLAGVYTTFCDYDLSVLGIMQDGVEQHE